MIHSVLSTMANLPAFTLFSAVDYICYAYIHAVFIISGPATNVVLISTVFAVTLMSVTMGCTFARTLFFHWVWHQETRKVSAQ